ncbi:MAG: nicotinamide riboside transporter PnuC [Candidatus Gastranaerophilales bacterium]|nr:nicotinamide riboside transporter PnuC [Candidatus Gastranaerophilales bacterium]
MVNIKGWKKSEIIFLSFVIVFIITHSIVRQDSLIATVSAICGITYTFIAGKGNPVCYLFGVTGSGFYSYLAFQNLLWGNLLLYLCYYIPMQILGFFQWNKNLKEGKKEIVKRYLPKKELAVLTFITIAAIIATAFVLNHFHDAHPILDSITTVGSIGGMYLTVRRAIEQWIFWMVVNFLSLIMWVSVAMGGARVYSTVIMWAVYLFLAFYFYFSWRKEIKYSKNNI